MAPRVVSKLVTAREQREGGGFMVRRPIGGASGRCDPFLMLDHFGPVTYGPGEALGAPDHPHRGFETVTYIIEGGTQHQDSAGNKGNLDPGWVQWMTAGSGVVHSEMPSDSMMKNGGRMEGFQLWVNLPAKDKMVPPRYQDTPPENIPVVTSTDGKVKVKVIAGEALGTKAVIQTRIPILYLDIHITAGGSYTHTIPRGSDGFAYVWRGKGFLASSKAEMGQAGILSNNGDDFEMRADSNEDCHVLLLAGVPINEPVCQHGPFVMNTRQEIEQAFSDYRAGKLGNIPGQQERYRQTDEAKKNQVNSGTWSKNI